MFAGQKVGIDQVDDRIWLVSFMQYDLGYLDDETCRLEPIGDPFGPTVLPMSPAGIKALPMYPERTPQDSKRMSVFGRPIHGATRSTACRSPRPPRGVREPVSLTHWRLADCSDDSRRVLRQEAEVFHRIQEYALLSYDGRTYRPRVYGEPQPNGSWASWIVFFPLDRSRAVATDRETTQSTLESLAVWAAGLTPVYLEGALVRALELAEEPLILATLEEAEYAALEDADRLQTAADVERATANIDEAAANAARADAERIRHERLVTESALAAADEAEAMIEADLHERAAGQARAIAAGAARRSRKAQTEASRQAESHRRGAKKR